MVLYFKHSLRKCYRVWEPFSRLSNPWCSIRRLVLVRGRRHWSTPFLPETRSIGPQLRASVKASLGRDFADDSLQVYIAYDRADQVLGRAVVSDEIGKYRPITFMVGLDGDFAVTGAAILVCRESRGGEVRRGRFLRQYRGKSANDPIRINRDIINITGATMSVRALNFGVRKVILLTEGLYGGSAENPVHPPPP